jgi:hypothetical protein
MAKFMEVIFKIWTNSKNNRFQVMLQMIVTT